MGHSTVRCDLRVDMTTLLLIEIDLSLEDVNFLGLTLKLCPEEVFLHLDVAFLLLILVVEDVLVVAIELTVERELLGTKCFNHVEQIGVHGDGTCKIALCSRQV